MVHNSPIWNILCHLYLSVSVIKEAVLTFNNKQKGALVRVGKVHFKPAQWDV